MSLSGLVCCFLVHHIYVHDNEFDHFNGGKHSDKEMVSIYIIPRIKC